MNSLSASSSDFSERWKLTHSHDGRKASSTDCWCTSTSLTTPVRKLWGINPAKRWRLILISPALQNTFNIGLPDFQSWNTGDFFTIAAIGVGAQSTLGEDIFAGRYMHEKLSKCPNFTIFARKIFFPNFGGKCPLPPISYAYDSRHAAFCQLSLSSSPTTFTDLRIQSNRR